MYGVKTGPMSVTVNGNIASYQFDSLNKVSMLNKVDCKKNISSDTNCAAMPYYLNRNEYSLLV